MVVTLTWQLVAGLFVEVETEAGLHRVGERRGPLEERVAWRTLGARVLLAVTAAVLDVMICNKTNPDTHLPPFLTRQSYLHC
jgi:hypothetical protein